jgi:hypothetical protein
LYLAQKAYIAIVALAAYRCRAMKSSDLNQWQRHALQNKIRPMSLYLTRLRKRMLAKGFRDDEPLFQAATDAERAVHSLYAHTHLLANPEPHRRV